MTMHPSEAQLNELVDGTLGPDERGRVERHVTECVPCTATVRRIEALVLRARSLPKEMTPPSEAWSDVRAALRQPRRPERERAGRFGRVGMLAAAAALVAVTAATTLWMTSERSRSAGSDMPFNSAEAPASLADFAPVEARYVLAVSALHETLNERRAQLDPRTIETVERSLATIDAAIGEARAALASDPANATLTRLLASSYEQKVTLLRRASELPPRS